MLEMPWLWPWPKVVLPHSGCGLGGWCLLGVQRGSPGTLSSLAQAGRLPVSLEAAGLPSGFLMGNSGYQQETIQTKKPYKQLFTDVHVGKGNGSRGTWSLAKAGSLVSEYEAGECSMSIQGGLGPQGTPAVQASTEASRQQSGTCSRKGVFLSSKVLKMENGLGTGY